MTAETRLPPMLTTTTAKALRSAGKRVTDATVARDQLIRVAVSEGGSLREVGEAVGLSHTAVAFIVRGRSAEARKRSKEKQQ